MIKPNVLINNRPYYDIGTAAQVLNTSVRSVQRIMARKSIQYLRYNRRPFISPESIDEYIDRMTVKAKKFLNKGTEK